MASDARAKGFRKPSATTRKSRMAGANTVRSDVEFGSGS
jgi:hypothetical protein